MIAKGSFEDFLYIFIGLIWIGFSIYKAQQKKKAADQGKVNTKKEKSFIENLMNEFLNEEPENPYYEVKSQEQKPVNTGISEKKFEKRVFSYDDYYEESNSIADFDVFEKKPDINTEFVKKVDKYKQKRRRNSKFDLRKAVIYSEILNRKYI